MPKVAVLMGSKSDWEVMKPAVDTLREFGVEVEVRVLSAHRTPDELREYILTAHERGVEVIIAGAGGAAHLPGVVASLTSLPVIGVPVPTQHLGGLDSLFSIVQMPSGVPVATVGIGAAKNAALLALRILGLKYPELSSKLSEFREKMRREVLSAKLE